MGALNAMTKNAYEPFTVRKVASPEVPKLYTPSDVMKIFQISRPTFEEWCRKGTFKKITIPGRRRVFVSAESVDKLIQAT